MRQNNRSFACFMFLEVSEKRRAKELKELKEGCKLRVNRFRSERTEWTPAEILSIRDCGDRWTEKKQFYIHYVDFNKRLDEWVDQDRLDLSSVEFPAQVRSLQISLSLISRSQKITKKHRTTMHTRMDTRIRQQERAKSKFLSR